MLGYLGASLFAAALCSVYVGSERTIYWWDYAGYQDLAARTVRAFEQSKDAGIEFVRGTLGQSYNALFALPLAPFLTLFGSTRLPYVLAVALIYQVPYAVVLGGIAARTLRAPRGRITWITAAVALLLPGLWLPVLRGYPDSAAALVFALAIVMYLADPTLERWWQPPVIGICLAGAVLIRRHFLVTVPAFLVAMAVVCFLERRRREPAVAARHAAARTAWLTGLSAAAGLAFAIVVAEPFVSLVATRDYYDLYRGYMLPISDAAYSLVVPYGIPIAIASATGLALGVRWGILQGPAALFVATEGLLAAAVWSIFIRQAGMQYCFHVAPAVVVGLVAWGWRLWSSSARSRTWVLPALAYLVVTFGVSLSRPPRADTVLMESLLPVSASPPFRDDLGALRSLVDRLRATCGRDRPVYVVSSSYTLNSDLLVQAERQFYGRWNTRLDVLKTPEVDTRDNYPISMLVNTRCVVVAMPIQLHLQPEEQDLVSVSYAMFRDRVGIASDFEPDPETVGLRWRVKVVLFRRVRATALDPGLKTLQMFERAVSEPASTQPDWVVVSGHFPAWESALGDSATRVVLHPAPRDAGAPTVAVHLGQGDGPVKVQGTLDFTDPRCRGVELRLGSVALGRGFEDAARIVRHPGGLPGFSASVNVPEGRRLALLVTIPEGQASIDYCLVRLDALSVSKGTGG
ncbi:MAG: hypothetical protein K1Y01_03660 [Vicinamibacteria bacterium]|nr:hypothetical protein [Vicinamibacteria bacterium]